MPMGLMDRGVTAETLEELLECRQEESCAEMAKDNVANPDVFCPFYKGTESNRQVLRCEGPYDNTAIRLGFAGKKKCLQHMERYCYTKECEKCRVYRCIMEKYEEEPE